MEKQKKKGGGCLRLLVLEVFGILWYNIGREAGKVLVLSIVKNKPKEVFMFMKIKRITMSAIAALLWFFGILLLASCICGEAKADKSASPEVDLSVSVTDKVDTLELHLGKVILVEVYLSTKEEMKPEVERARREIEEKVAEKFGDSTKHYLWEILLKDKRVSTSLEYFKRIKSITDVLIQDNGVPMFYNRHNTISPDTNEVSHEDPRVPIIIEWWDNE